MRVHQRPQHRVLVGEVLIQGSDRQARSFGDAVGGPGGISVLGENVSSRVEDALPGFRGPLLFGLLALPKSVRRGDRLSPGVKASSQVAVAAAKLGYPNYCLKEMVLRTVHVETVLPTSADHVWSAMLAPATFLYVCRGLFGFPALAGRTEPLRRGERGTGWLMACHVIPAYRHTIEVVDVDEASGTIRTREHGGVLKAWNHTLHVEALQENSCRYSDTVDIDAGVFTGAVVVIANGLFKYRQRRWHKLVRRAS